MGCPCEQSIQSKVSPGLVKGCEDIVYCLLDPDLFDLSTGKLKNAAFSKTQLRKNRLSCVRKSFSNIAEINNKVINPQISKNPNRRFCGVFVCQSAKIRAINENSEQDICVSDAGLPDFPSHAHLGFSSTIARSNKSIQVAVRANLINAFEARGRQELKSVFEERTANVVPTALCKLSNLFRLCLRFVAARCRKCLRAILRQFFP